MIVGIDLGTTNSLVAAMGTSGPELIKNAFGDSLTPSVVGLDRDGHVVVGRAARELQSLLPDRCTAAFKRHMGTDWKVTLGGQTFGPVELSSLVLKSLKGDAEAHFGRTITDSVITVPAYFNEHQRQATISAGKLAGLNVRRILNEPTAAAIAYGLHEMADDQTFAVYDLGGGTFDISIVERFEGVLEVRASSGETFLGGEDFTSTMATRVLTRVGLMLERVEQKSPLLVAVLRRECEVAKRTLSRENEATVRIPAADGSIGPDCRTVVLSRAEFEEWTDVILSRTDSPIRRCLGDARIRREQIDEVLLVGGATRMPSVRKRVAERFGREPRCTLNPDEVVALGAAVQAGLIAQDKTLGDIVVTDVSPFTLGVEICQEIAGEDRDGYFLPIINSNTPIPTTRTKTVGTVQANQQEVTVSVYQGDARRVEGNLLLGKFMVKGIPRGPAGQLVEIRFTYDLNGVLEVEALVLATKAKTVIVITKHAQGMSPEQVQAAVTMLQALKAHPREEEVNKRLFWQAERLYKELPIHLRGEMDDLLRGYDEAMELRDAAAIDRFRQELDRFLRRYDSSLDFEQPFE